MSEEREYVGVSVEEWDDDLFEISLSGLSDSEHKKLNRGLASPEESEELDELVELLDW